MFLRSQEANQTARRITTDVHARIRSSITEYNAAFGRSFDAQGLVDRFVRANLHDKGHRSIVSSLYTFVLESGDRELQLLLRSIDGGSVEPLLLHFLKGALIFESILKETYTSMAGAELGSILQDGSIRSRAG